MANDLNSPATIDYIRPNGSDYSSWGGSGSLAKMLLKHGMNHNVLRPYEGDDGRDYITVANAKGEPEARLIGNNEATLRFQDWRLIDDVVIKVAKPQLKMIGELRSRGLEVSLTNGMAFSQFSYETMSDISAADINMSPVTRTESDRVVFDIRNLPLPIIQKDFQLDARQVLASRNGSTALDTANAEAAAVRVAEAAESLLLGVLPTYSYGGGTISGITNYDKRMTKVMTAPTANGWTPAITVQEVLAMRQQSVNAWHRGPWMLLTSLNWDPYLDEDYSSAKGDWTLRQRLSQIKGIVGIETVDFLSFLSGTPYTMVLVQMTSNVIREVVGLDITTIQWESHGGMMMNYKVMCIMVPQLRHDQNSNTGIVHGSATYP